MKRNPNEPKTLAELAATAEADPDVWELRLYVAGKTAKSVAAFENLTKLCEEHLRGKYKIEVVDLLVHPQLATGRPDRRHPHPGPQAARADPQGDRRPVQRGAHPGGAATAPRQA